ncbi:MAG: tRNA uridine(34) 5-carboxymethylaminomethyl modification radical SAM/GNAT enzyme Elp3, partial [bacterium]|nr:tRNA uridine(34) 5-carboxymethylaminomethyl modification radical SAM/GNAT enzyme Elp3 [bacterium]
KRRASKKHKIPCPSNIELLKAYHKLNPERSELLESLLRTRPVRSLSGIVNVSVLTKPYPCPGKCLYCPIEKGIPKSYVSGEPAVERAKRLRYNPYLQTKKRLEMLEIEGHPTDKAELRIVGGTWSYYPKRYQEWFIKRCFEACNGKTSRSLSEAQSSNEKSEHRIVGLSVETRPDFINKEEILNLRNLGATKVELGVQSVYDKVLKKSLRGHDIMTTIEATKILKDAGFKVSYQMMLNLPGSTPQKDIKMFETLFRDPDFQPDLLKIYPCAILKEAPLYQWYLKGKYRPYSEKTLIKTIKEIKKSLPYYVRVERITRDIPSPRISAGLTKISNLRQTLKKEIQKEGWACRCIRCREIKERYDPKEKMRLWRQDYKASKGREIFLTFENLKKTKLFSLLKLRIPANPYPSALEGAAIIREIHTYGQLVPIAKRKSAPQHKGLGKKLIEKAEKITKEEFKLKKIAVIAAVGTRGYFRKLGYRLEDTYMVKYFLL